MPKKRQNNLKRKLWEYHYLMMASYLTRIKNISINMARIIWIEDLSVLCKSWRYATLRRKIVNSFPQNDNLWPISLRYSWIPLSTQKPKDISKLLVNLSKITHKTKKICIKITKDYFKCLLTPLPSVLRWGLNSPNKL